MVTVMLTCWEVLLFFPSELCTASYLTDTSSTPQPSVATYDTQFNNMLLSFHLESSNLFTACLLVCDCMRRSEGWSVCVCVCVCVCECTCMWVCVCEWIGFIQDLWGRTLVGVSLSDPDTCRLAALVAKTLIETATWAKGNSCSPLIMFYTITYIRGTWTHCSWFDKILDIFEKNTHSMHSIYQVNSTKYQLIYSKIQQFLHNYCYNNRKFWGEALCIKPWVSTYFVICKQLE